MPRRRRAEVHKKPEQTEVSNTLELPGFHYDPVSKKYFKISKDYKCPKVVSDKKTPVAFYPNVFSQRQQGLLKIPFPQTMFTGLSERAQCPIVPDRQVWLNCGEYSCSMLVASPGVDTVFCIWTTSQQHVAAGPCELVHRGQVDGQPDSSYSLALPRKLYYFSAEYKLMDACAAKIDASRCGLLICQIRREFEPTPRASSSTGLLFTPFTSSETNRTEQWGRWFFVGKDVAFSCAYDSHFQRMAFGMLKGGFVRCLNDTDYNSANANKGPNLYSQHDGLFCVTFGSKGHCVLSGSRRGVVYCHDLRDHPAERYAYKIVANDGALRCLSILRNDVEAICSGDRNCLLRLDLRMRRPVLRYAEHLNEYLKIPFTIEEGLGILCSTGGDGCTRLWNVDNGRLLRSIPSPVPVYEDAIPSAVFKQDWDARTTMPALILALKEKAYIYHI